MNKEQLYARVRVSAAFMLQLSTEWVLIGYESRQIWLSEYSENLRGKQYNHL